MKLLVLCVLAMMVTVAMSRRWNFVAHRHVSRQYRSAKDRTSTNRSAMKTGIITGFNRQLDGWLVQHGQTVSDKERKILRFVNIRYMQTHWPSFLKFARERMKKLANSPTEHDYLSIGAEIGRRVPLRFSYGFLIRKGLLPRWADYMQDLLDTPPGDIKCKS
ncbi:egg-lysin-like isoform X1 [Haliotis rubra]|uniref:egg-lysin-like isoform X1 n=1 Tax=Haliotis rubra TaxID=36100 RepID=UPI001EE5DFE5|nr:egg-lysin-like isoform X1 [Haliotis rubra]XP_046546078.1 egg-lysin-like isoform X1 [Haliotis rubra]